MNERIQEAFKNFIEDLEVDVVIDGYKTTTDILEVDIGKGRITIELDLGIKDMITYMPFKYVEEKHKFMFTTKEIEEMDDYPF